MRVLMVAWSPGKLDILLMKALHACKPYENLRRDICPDGCWWTTKVVSACHNLRPDFM